MKSARVFQPTVLFHSPSQPSQGQTPTEDNYQPEQPPELVWPHYMLSLRNYINSPCFIQFQPALNTLHSTDFMGSKSSFGNVCPLGCLAAAASSLDKKTVTPDTGEVDSKLSGESVPSYQALDLMSTVKCTRREASFPDGLENKPSTATTTSKDITSSERPQEHQHGFQVEQGNNFISRTTETKLPFLSKVEEKRLEPTYDSSIRITGRKRLHCPFCEVSCSNHGQLRGHLRCHTGEKPFHCTFDGCTSQFARNEELTRHKRIHTGLRPFVCTSCNKTFGRKDHLQKHSKTHLEPGQKKSFVCPVCHQGYSRSDALKRHKATAHPESNKYVI